MVSRRSNADKSRLAVAEYRRKGWDVFPLPLGAKFPPPKGVTGYKAQPITDRDYKAWEDEWANIGLVVPDGVVGIDYDGYKSGNSLPADLPPTIRSTSRQDGSGIFLFRVPGGTRLNGSVPGVGEVIQRFHRYAVAWPSIHPEGRRYRWLDSDGNEAEIPDVDDLPDLPEAWLERLAERPRRRTGKNKGKAYTGDVDDWLDGLPTGAMSPKVRNVVRDTVRSLRRYSLLGDCRYDVMVRAVGQLVALGAQRHRGVERALDDVWVEYTGALEGTPDRDPEAELYRAISGAIAKFGGAR